MNHCAICTSTTPPFTPQPLGRNNALVPVCAACDEPAFEKREPERGYEPSGGVLSREEMAAACAKLQADPRWTRAAMLDEEHSRTPFRGTGPVADKPRRAEHRVGTRKHAVRR